jgi:predicted esterase
MHLRLNLVFSLPLLFSACAGADADQDNPWAGGDATVMQSSPVAPGPADASLAPAPGGGATLAGASGGTSGGSAGAGTAGGGTLGSPDAGPSSGMMGGTAGMAGTTGMGGTTGGSTGPGPSVSGPGPVIPPHSGACPSLQSGTQTIMGLQVEVYAGAPSTSAKGPLLFFWHGTMGNGKMSEFQIPAAVRSEIMAQGGMIIAPTDNETVRSGTDVTFLLAVWYTGADLEMADLIASCAIENHNIDPRRIYTTGCSAGGLMAGTMVYQRSGYLAASAPNSGGIAPIPGIDKVQDPKHLPPTMTMHGAMGSDWVILDFAESSADLYNGLKAKGGFAIDCDHGGGHCAAPAALLTASWQFMKDHPFGVSPEPYANGLPASFPSYCKIIK